MKSSFEQFAYLCSDPQLCTDMKELGGGWSVSSHGGSLDRSTSLIHDPDLWSWSWTTLHHSWHLEIHSLLLSIPQMAYIIHFRHCKFLILTVCYL